MSLNSQGHSACVCVLNVIRETEEEEHSLKLRKLIITQKDNVYSTIPIHFATKLLKQSKIWIAHLNNARARDCGVMFYRWRCLPAFNTISLPAVTSLCWLSRHSPCCDVTLPAVTVLFCCDVTVLAVTSLSLLWWYCPAVTSLCWLSRHLGASKVTSHLKPGFAVCFPADRNTSSAHPPDSLKKIIFL